MYFHSKNDYTLITTIWYAALEIKLMHPAALQFFAVIVGLRKAMKMTNS